ncbi:MAG: hypothetical protein KDA96_14470 [Planctomycetaceae bacterium]|nr:hypothetical protein [Planctomycetaceae bacterium]
MSDKHYVHREDPNELAMFLDKAKPWFEKNGTIVIYTAAAILAIAAVWVFLNKKTAPVSVSAERLMQVQASPSIEEYQTFAEEFPESGMSVWANLIRADALLSQGVSSLFSNRSLGLENIDAAEKIYEQIDNRADANREIRIRVAYGRAVITESRCDGGDASTTDAIAAWQKLSDLLSDESRALKELAEERIRHLNSEGGRDFYAWFHAQNPNPNDPPLLPQGHPPVSSVPEMPESFKVPGVEIPTLPLDDGEKADTPAESTEGEKANTPAESAEGEKADTPAVEKTETPAQSSEGSETKSEDAQGSVEEPKESP